MKTFLLSILLTSSAFAKGPSINTGIPASSLTIQCRGQMKIVGVEDIISYPPSHTRAGPQPAYGTAKLVLEVIQLNPECEALKTGLGIDLQATKFTSYFRTTATDLAVIKFKAEQKIGNTGGFYTQQYFGFEDKNGVLPFFPLLHSEHVNVISLTKEFSIYHNFVVDVKKTYGIDNGEAEKVQLTDEIYLHILGNSTKDPLAERLFHEMLVQYPSYQEDFERYFAKVLHIYQLFENEKYEKYDVTLPSIAMAMTKLLGTHQAYRVIKPFELFIKHPSLLLEEKVNLTAQQLEEVMDLVELDLKQQSFNPNIEERFKKVLESVAGVYPHTVTLQKLSSNYSKEKAKYLLKIYYGQGN